MDWWYLHGLSDNVTVVSLYRHEITALHLGSDYVLYNSPVHTNHVYQKVYMN